MKHLLLAALMLVGSMLGQNLNGGISLPYTNGTGGTTINQLAVVSQGLASNASTSSTLVVPYIVTSATTTAAGGNAFLAVVGKASCFMDTNLSVAGTVYVIASTTIAGYCHPQSGVPSSGIGIVGFLADSSATSGQVARVEVHPGIWATGGGGGGSVTASGYSGGTPLAAFTTGTNITPATYANVVALWNSCSGVQYLGFDGVCHSAGTGTVLTVTVSTANGVAATVLNQGTNPQLTFSLGAIVPATVDGLTISPTSGTLNIATPGAFTVNNILTLSGTDGSTLNVGAGGTLGTAAFTATPTAASITALIQGLSGCGTATYVYVPAGSNCVAQSGGISGLTTGYIPKAGSATTVVNSNADDGITTANVFTIADSGGLNVSSGPIVTGTNPGVCGTATGCEGATEGTASSMTPTASADACTWDTSHLEKCTINNGTIYTSLRNYSAAIPPAWGTVGTPIVDKTIGFLATSMSTQSSATLTAITGMSWTLTASKNYLLKCNIPIIMASSGTLAFGLVGPGTPTAYNIDFTYKNGTVPGEISLFAQAAWVSTATSATSSLTSSQMYNVVAQIQNGTTGGTLTLDTSNAAATGTIQVLAGATCELKGVN